MLRKRFILFFMLMNFRLELSDLEWSNIRRRDILSVDIEQVGAIIQLLQVLRELFSKYAVNWKNVRGGNDETLSKMPIPKHMLTLRKDSSPRGGLTG